MTVEERMTYFRESRPSVMVVSHERSGTHFLMNSLAACYGYVALPRIDLDIPNDHLLRHYKRAQLSNFLLGLASRPMANIVKSHHVADFFGRELERITERYVIFVIYRNPIDVMVSFWRFIHRFLPSIKPGPQVTDPVTFARATPSGQMLRYQMQPSATVLQRWEMHVKGWCMTAQRLPRIRLVRYEDLHSRFESTIESFASVLERPPQALTRPSRDFNIILGGPTDPMKTGIPPDYDALRRLCQETVGDTLAMLGYS